MKDDNLKAALLDARNRIAVVASIHQRLYMNGEHSLVDVAEFLEELVTATIRSLSIQDKISTKLDLQHGISLGIDRAVPLALVVAELLTNSLKYAFAEKEKGTVGVDLDSDGSAITVRIYDDGLGFAQAKPSSGETGLGTKIIRALSKQIRAALSEKSDQNGTEVTLVMPLK